MIPASRPESETAMYQDETDDKALCRGCGVQTLDSRLDSAGRCEGCRVPEAPGATLAAVFCQGFQARSGPQTGCQVCGQPFADHTLGTPRDWAVHLPGEWTHRELAKFRRGLARLLDKHPGATSRVDGR